MLKDFPQILVGLLVAVLVGWYSHSSELYYFVGDDGAITLRYASRLGQGLGITYNDGEAVNGATHLIQTLSLGSLIGLGWTAGGAVTFVGTLTLALSLGLGAFLLAKRSGFLSAGFFVVAYLSSIALYAEHFNGMESAWVFLLGLLFLHSLHTGSSVYRGVILGLLVANKLDGGLAALAFALHALLARRKLVWREALTALVVTLPFAALLLWQFGSILPQAMLTKLGSHTTSGGFDRTWLLDQIWLKRGWLCVLALVPLLRPAHWRGSAPVIVFALWGALHTVAFSLVDLGDPFPWYAATPIFVLTVLAAIGFGDLLQWVASAMRRETPRTRPHGDASDRTPLPLWVGALGALLLLTYTFTGPWQTMRWRVQRNGTGVALPPGGVQDLGRQAAGAWLRKHTSGTELLCSLYGLPALEYEGPFFDYTGLNSLPDDARALTSVYFLAGANFPLPAPVASLPRVGVFRYGVETEPYYLYARPDSEVVLRGLVHDQVPLTELVIEVEGDTDWRAGPNALEWSGAGSLAFELEGAVPPVLGFDATAQRAAELTLRVNGVELHRASLEPGQTTRVEAPTLEPAEGRYRVELQASAPADLRLSGFRIRFGDALEPEDFQLRCPRWSRRIAYAKDRGIPDDRALRQGTAP